MNMMIDESGSAAWHLCQPAAVADSHHVDALSLAHTGGRVHNDQCERAVHSTVTLTTL